METYLNGYKLLMPFQNKDAGFSRWTFGEKDGSEYFIKEFLDPVYPVEKDLSQEITDQMFKACDNFVNERTQIYKEINSAADGNIIRIKEFFRGDSRYYVVTDRVTDLESSLDNISAISLADKHLLCRCLAHSLLGLEDKGIVHGDLKLTNILFHRTCTGKIIGKIIDFDSAFFENNPTEPENVTGCDQVYIAPETVLFLCGSEIKLTCKVDVFSLGIVFHQIFTGVQPLFDKNKYGFVAEALLNGDDICISEKIPSDQRMLLKEMLKLEPDERISISEVYGCLGDIMGMKTEKTDYVGYNYFRKAGSIF